MLTRDRFVALLEKRAFEESSVPENDSAASASEEYKKNMADNRETIHSLFDQAGNIETYQTKVYKDLFSNIEGRKESGNPLLKIARDMFYRSVMGMDLMKIASPMHVETTFRSFLNELEKIAEQR